MNRRGRTRLCYAILILCSPLLVPLACTMWPLLLVADLCARVRYCRNKEEIESERDDRRVVRCEEGRYGTEEGEEVGLMQRYLEDQLRYLNKALLSPDGSKGDDKVCSLGEVEEANAVLRLIPIWVTTLIYAVVFSQSPKFFTKQGVTMDRTISTGFNVPPASLQSFISLSIVPFVPIYERILVPLMRVFTRKPSGITMLQRIGIGMFLSTVSMVIAALVEMKRLEIARDIGLVDLPDDECVVWLIPQYVLFGISDVFTMVGLQEFFYDQVPTELRSVGLSLYLSIFGVGNLLSIFLVSSIEKATGGEGRYSWFASNLNRAHLDYFYWLLAGFSALELMVYTYKKESLIFIIDQEQYDRS